MHNALRRDTIKKRKKKKERKIHANISTMLELIEIITLRKK